MNLAPQRVIHTFIKRIARRLHTAILCERVLTVLTVGLIALLLGVGLMPFASTQPWLVSAVAMLAWGALAVALVRLLQTCLQRRSLESAALYVETKRPELHNHLISALQLPESLQKHPESGISSDLVDSLLEVTQRHHEVMWTKVKGHSKTQGPHKSGNDRADELAVAAKKEATRPSTPSSP